MTPMSKAELANECRAIDRYRHGSAQQQGDDAALEQQLRQVAAATYDEFISLPFQRMLWNSKAVADPGWGGNISVESAMADIVLVERLWSLRNDALPPAIEDRLRYLVDAFEECQSLIRPHVRLMPTLKLFNVFAALQPTEFTTISFDKFLRKFARMLGLDARGPIHPIRIHRAILDRLRDLVGEVAPPPARPGVERMLLPWLLLKRSMAEAVPYSQDEPAAPAFVAEEGADEYSAIPPAVPLRRPAVADLYAAFPPDAVFDAKLVARLDAGLWSDARRHFAVLAGLSGSGKTLLAGAYARALHGGPVDMDKPCAYLHILPVQPGWHDPSHVLGYVNPLQGAHYVRTGLLDFLLRAGADPARPYVAVLDEMNLSHPEQYLAPLLSAMETGGAIELHTFDGAVDGVPPRLPYPANLVLIGTVNMDETTHGLSDKVLDRAAVLEFWDVDVARHPRWEATTLDGPARDQARALLAGLYGALRPVRLHFGWRTVGDVLGYLEEAARGGVLGAAEALDHAVYAKVLPKLRGDDSLRLREALAATARLLGDAGLAESAAKVEELGADLQYAGSARFWR